MNNESPCRTPQQENVNLPARRWTGTRNKSAPEGNDHRMPVARRDRLFRFRGLWAYYPARCGNSGPPAEQEKQPAFLYECTRRELPAHQKAEKYEARAQPKTRRISLSLRSGRMA